MKCCGNALSHAREQQLQGTECQAVALRVLKGTAQQEVGSEMIAGAADSLVARGGRTTSR